VLPRAAGESLARKTLCMRRPPPQCGGAQPIVDDRRSPRSTDDDLGSDDGGTVALFARADFRCVAEITARRSREPDCRSRRSLRQWLALGASVPSAMSAGFKPPRRRRQVARAFPRRVVPAVAGTGAFLARRGRSRRPGSRSYALSRTGLAVAGCRTMTRSYGASRSSARRVDPTRPRPARDPRSPGSGSRASVSSRSPIRNPRGAVRAGRADRDDEHDGRVHAPPLTAAVRGTPRT